MEIKKSASELARGLMLTEYQGVLSTHSVDSPGYPFGSIVPYCFDRLGQPVILISRIAQHTKNIWENPKVSLLVAEGQADDSQAVGRVTYLGDAILMSIVDNDISERYYRFFPQSRDYHKTHDFDFYTLESYRVRYIGGFGKIHWIEKQEFLLANPFNAEDEVQMLKHMNQDHVEAMRHYCADKNILIEDDTDPVMVGIDSEGFNLRVGQRLHRFTFNESVKNSMQVRKALVDMARE